MEMMHTLWNHAAGVQNLNLPGLFNYQSTQTFMFSVTHLEYKDYNNLYIFHMTTLLIQ